MTATHTRTTTRTYTQTATHVADSVVAALAETLIAVGVSADEVMRVYGYSKAISAWIEERALGHLRVTLVGRDGFERAAYSFDFDYSTFDPSQQFRDQLARLRRQIAKEPKVQPGTGFQITAVSRPGWTRSPQPGWSPRTTPLPNFDGGYRHATVASGPGADSVLRSYRTN